MTTPRIFILPSGEPASTYTLLTLPYPSTSSPTRYLLHPSPTGLLYELAKVPNSSVFPRSWLLTKRPQSADDDDDGDAAEHTPTAKANEGLVVQEAHLYMATPIDPLYLLLPHLLTGKTTKNYLPLDDILETHPHLSTWNKILRSSPTAEQQIHDRIKHVCDTVDAGGEVVYRLNEGKVLEVLTGRVETMAGRLPGSIRAYIHRQLVKPLSVETVVEEVAEEVVDVQGAADEGVVDDSKLEEEDMQTTADSQLALESQAANLSNLTITATTVTTTTTTETTTTTNTAAAAPPPPILYLSSISHALQLLQPYLPPTLHTTLTTHINTVHPPSPLTAYIAEIKSLREAAAIQIESSMMHAKRTFEDIEGGVSKEDTEREKKRKKKEEEARKSQAVKKLEKVNTRGMAKMTAFFKKKE